MVSVVTENDTISPKPGISGPEAALTGHTAFETISGSPRTNARCRLHSHSGDLGFQQVKQQAPRKRQLEMISRSTYLGEVAAKDKLLFGIEKYLAVLAHHGP